VDFVEDHAGLVRRQLTTPDAGSGAWIVPAQVGRVPCEAERLAEALARLTGESKTEAVIRALRDRLARLRRERSGRRLADELDDIGRRCAVLPVRDSRSADEIVGYDERGAPR
jgi:antitoxin VapB